MGSLPTPSAVEAVVKSSSADIIYRSKLPDIDIPNHLPLHTYCFQNMGTLFSPDRPCIINGATGEVFTYAEVELMSRKVAAGLQNILGVKQGDVVMLLLPNSPEFAFAFLAASYLGAMSTTANPFYTPPEVHKQARGAGAKVVITLACYAEKVRVLAEEDGVRVVCIDGDSDQVPVFKSIQEDGNDSTTVPAIRFTELLSADESTVSFSSIHINPDDVVALPFSSGTTGLPKGVMLTHRGLVTSVAQQVDGENPNLYFHPHDVVLCVLPLFHIYSLNSVLLCGLRAGSAVLIMPKFDITHFLELVQKYKVTIAPLVPPIVLALAKSPAVDAYDLSSVRTVMSGAAPMGKELEDTVRAKLPNAKLGQGYGMTEAGPVLSMCLAFAKQPFEIKSGACGTVVRNAELKIVDPETGKSMPRNQPGEICIRGAQIMKGYLNDPEATARTIDSDGWLHTGDIGIVDDDDEIFIVDRLKELIKYKGFQVAPAEIEAMLLAHPEISDAAVVPMKEESAGELPVAFVVRSKGSEITEAQIRKYVADQVIFYKRIHRVFFQDSIPKAPSGKILRKDLRAKLAAGVPAAQ